MDNIKTDFHSIEFKPIEIKKIRTFRWYNPFTWFKPKYKIKDWKFIEFSLMAIPTNPKSLRKEYKLKNSNRKDYNDKQKI